VAAVSCATVACSLNFDYLRGDPSDAAVDGPILDASHPDASHPDASIVDASRLDTSILDSSAHDATDTDAPDGTLDVGDSALDGAPDVDNSSDAGTPDTGTGPIYDPALLPDAATVLCPITITDALGTLDPVQTGRTSRYAPSSACGSMAKAYPSTGADPSSSHIFHAYRFANPADAATNCFTFNLTYDATSPQKYMMVYSTFYPADLAQGWLGDVGGQLVSPQPMSISVAPGTTVDVVVLAIDTAPAGANAPDPDGAVPVDGGPGAFVLTCTAQ
jgi:hypothetical protein